MIEALVALAVLAIGVVGLLRWHGAMAVASEAVREQAVAVQWLRSVIEADRGQADRLAAGLREPAPGAPPRPVLHQATAGDGMLATTVYTARWVDRTGATQAWSFAVQEPAPDLDAADFFEAGWAPTGSAPRGAAGRAAVLPRDATDLGDATSVVPTTASGLAGWVLDRDSGEVIGVCRAGAPAVSADPGGADVRDTADLRPRRALPAGCEPLAARLIVGVLRFALGPSPRLEGPYDDPLPLVVEWRDASGRTVTPGCDVQPVRGADPHLVWRCAVPSPAVVGLAHPEPTLRPLGWTLHGPQPTHRLCRVRAAPTGSGLRSGFVVEASQPCPEGADAVALDDLAGRAPGQSGGDRG
jgi:Tfp pilus assembly protein PilV